MAIYRTYQLIFLFFGLIALSCHAQNHSRFWYFGAEAGLNFPGNGSQALTDGALSSFEACATYSDDSGNLQFYTNGVQVWNKNHQQMPNGFDLAGDTSTTQTLIVPLPCKDSLAYIFTAHHYAGINDPTPGGFHYSLVNLRAHNGLGDVVLKNVFLFGPSTEKMTMIRHANGLDVWVIAHEWNNRHFRAYKVSCNGIDTNYVRSVAGTALSSSSSNSNAAGYLKASRDGKLMAMTVPLSGQVDLYHFDASNGKIKFLYSLPLSLPSNYGVEFSPDASKLYVGTTVSSPGNPAKLIQFDLYSSDPTQVLQSETTVAEASTTGKFGAIQLAPDGKIYVCELFADYLKVIHQPDLTGTNCQYQDSAVFLQNKITKVGLPHIYPPLKDSMDFTWNKLCSGQPVLFNNRSDYAADSVLWQVRDSSGNIIDLSTHTNGFFLFNSPGEYQVSLIHYRNCKVDTLSKQVFIHPSPDISLVADTLGDCDSTYLKLEAIGSGSYEYLWSSGDTTPFIYTQAAGNYAVNVSDSFCSTYLTYLFSLDLSTGLTLPEDTVLCEGDSLHLELKGTWTKIRWSTGDTSRSIKVAPDGVYYVSAERNGCIYSDTIQAAKEGSLNILWSDDLPTLCPNTETTLFPVFNQDLSRASYRWSTGDTTAGILIEQPGLYTLTVTTSCNRIMDSIWVRAGVFPELTLSEMATICNGQTILLEPDAISGTYAYRWSTGDTTATLLVSTPGDYFLTAYTACGSLTEHVSVSLSAQNGPDFPTVISPNGDGINDQLAFTARLPRFTLSIMNRWGNEVYFSQDPALSWPRSNTSKELPEGVYFYHVQYEGCKGNLVERSGNIVLVR